MAYRFTNTDKWNDSWFSELKQLEKLLFMYMCDNCDIAGFIEININRFSTDLCSSKDTIKGALKGLERGLIFSESEDCVYVKNFLKHQKNLPLNEKNKAHLGIIKRFELYKNKFKISNIEEFINQDFKPLQRGYGIGIGNITDNIISLKDETWRENFEIYKSELRTEYNKLKSDKEWIIERENYHPNLDILLSLKKACVDYWATEAGWKKKKASKTKKIDWKSTLNTALTLKSNQVYKQSKNGKIDTSTNRASEEEFFELVQLGLRNAEQIKRDNDLSR